MSFTWKRTHTVAAVASAAVLVGGGIGVATALSGPDPEPVTGPTPTVASGGATPTSRPPKKAETKPFDYLTGGKRSSNEVFAVKVENIALARPQVGLHDADIVFAEEVEGGQTRLIAIYHRTFPTAVEPVRSARTTDVQLLPLFGKPGLVYSGANSRVQRKIDRASIVPIYNATRDPRRVAPHNVRANLKQIAAKAKVGRAQSIGWTFAKQAPKGAQARSAKVRVGNDTFGFGYAGGRYTVRWNGQTYADGDDRTITKADNVVVLDVHNSADGNRDVLGTPSVHSDTTGHGTLSVYRNGVRITGTWKRAGTSRPLRLLDDSGAKIPLHPGKTWVLLKG